MNDDQWDALIRTLHRILNLPQDERARVGDIAAVVAATNEKVAWGQLKAGIAGCKWTAHPTESEPKAKLFCAEIGPFIVSVGKRAGEEPVALIAVDTGKKAEDGKPVRLVRPIHPVTAKRLWREVRASLKGDDRAD